MPHRILIKKVIAFISEQLPHFEWNDVKISMQLYNTLLCNPDEKEIKLRKMQWKEFCCALQPQLPPTPPLEAFDIIPERLGHVKNLLIMQCSCHYLL